MFQATRVRSVDVTMVIVLSSRAPVTDPADIPLRSQSAAASERLESGFRMINRQRALIRLISNENGCITKLRLVKLSFLLQATALELPRSNLYEFVPYNHGPYSFTLTHELRAIERDGWIRISESEVKLLRSADAEMAKMGYETTKEVDTISRRYQRVTTSILVTRV